MMEFPFSPNKDILPPAQKELWPKLRAASELGFVLYGGTAIALRLGHRVSVDFDLFMQSPLEKQKLEQAFPAWFRPAHEKSNIFCLFLGT